MGKTQSIGSATLHSIGVSGLCYGGMVWVNTVIEVTDGGKSHHEY